MYFEMGANIIFSRYFAAMNASLQTRFNPAIGNKAPYYRLNPNRSLVPEQMVLSEKMCKLFGQYQFSSM